MHALFLLGPPRIEREGQTLDLTRRKATALFAYLAVTGKSQRRETLAALFWPEADSFHSRSALRRVISDINQALGEGWANPGEISLSANLNLWIDVNEFRERAAARLAHEHPPEQACPLCLPQLVEAARLYRDHFMAGFSLPDSPAFDEWQFYESEGLQRELAGVLHALISFYLNPPAGSNPSYQAALPYARRWASLDPLNEIPQGYLMQLYARSGQSSAALRQYRQYARLLEKEIGAQPDPSLAVLYDQIRRGVWAPRPLYQTSTQTGIRPSTAATDWQIVDHQASPALENSIQPAVGNDSSQADSLQVEDEIRLITTLFVGLSNQASQIWQANPSQMAEAARRLVRLARPVAARYEGHADHFIGQGFFISFGVLQSHEDDAERALRAALEIKNAARIAGLGVSLGVSTGQVYFSHRRDDLVQPEESELPGMLVGPTLNLAARLQNLASIYQILVSPVTYNLTRGAFEFAELYPETLSPSGNANHLDNLEVLSLRTAIGKDAQTIYQLLGSLDIPEKARGIEGLSARLIGREDEMSKLREALTLVLNGRGLMISLVGEAGIGKSRLIAELKQNAISMWEQGTLMLWLESRCQEWRMSTSYWPFIDLFSDLLYFFSSEGLDRAGSLAALLEDMEERGDLDSQRVEDMGALLGNLLSIRFGNSWDERLKNASPEQVRHQTCQAIYDFLTALARQQPLVLVFEDLHWADDPSIDLLSMLMEALAEHPIMLLCLYRSQRGHKGERLENIAEQKISEFYEEIRLRELHPDQSLRLARALLGEAPCPPEVNEMILKRSWGNPFFVEEALRALIDQGILHRKNGQWEINAHTEALSIPESVQSVIQGRVDRLDGDLKITLRSASVIGRNFSTRILSQIVPPELDLERALWALEEAALIYRLRVLPEVEYTFKHILTRDAVYQTIALRQRADLHLRVATAIENRYQLNEPEPSLLMDETREVIEQLAFHYQRSPLDEKAIEYLLKAGEKARLGYHNPEAIAYFQQALHRWGETYSEDGSIISETHASTAVSSSPAECRSRLFWKLAALTGLGQIYHGIGDEIQAEKYLLQAIAIGQAVELETAALVRLYYWLGEALHWQRRYTEQIHLGQVGRSLLSEEEAESLEAALMNQIIAIGYLGRGEQPAFQKYTETTASFIQRLPYSEELRPAYMHIALNLYNQREVDQASQWLRVLQQLAQEHHDLRALAEVYDYQWGYQFSSGDLRQGIEDCQQVLGLYERIGDNFRSWRCQRDLAWGCLMLGDLDAANQHAELSNQLANKISGPVFQAEASLIAGLVWMCQGERPKARQAFEKAQTPLRAGDWSWTEWIASYCLGRVYLASENYPEAKAQFQLALHHYVPFHVPLGWWFNRWPVFACLLSGLEEACICLKESEDGAYFQKQCTEHNERSRHLDNPLVPAQWQLQQASGSLDQGNHAQPPTFEDSFCHGLQPGWEWIDPAGDGSYQIDHQLEICAANGRDLWHLNLSAPRLLRPAAREFKIQTLCLPASLSRTQLDQPAPSLSMGGLLLWHDDQNFLRLVLGLRGENDLTFEGCVENGNILIGRGLIPTNCSEVKGFLLRLESKCDLVSAYCALTPEPGSSQPDWYLVGQIAFPTRGNLMAGLHAAGWIDRTIHHGAYPAGARMRFKHFKLWNK
ncbi:MAG: AAA family ATPase [Anaerolineales bacterium]|nr:AAA family ATPase [Anaerolineales bacterium]